MNGSNVLDLYVPGHSNSIGGPNTFLRNFHLASKKMATYYSFRKKNIFFPISYDLKDLDLVKSKNGLIIQRLDGIYYPSKHGEKYHEYNTKIKDIYLNYATHVVFQSEYSKKQCFEMFGEITHYSIIYNGANSDIFYPESREEGRKVVFITTGNFRNLDMIEPIIKALDSIQSFEFELQIIGPITLDSLKPLLNRSYCRHLGDTNCQKKIASYLRDADAFIYSHLNPPCPNSVIEAISCGLPVLGFRSGAMAELCSFNLELLAEVSKETFQKYSDFDSRKLATVIEEFARNYGHYKKRALENSSMFNLDECVSKYINLFKSLGVESHKGCLQTRLMYFLRDLLGHIQKPLFRWLR